jgi:hypothetical protein
MRSIKYFLLVLNIVVITSCSEDTIDSLEFGTLTGKVVQEGSYLPVENVKISTNPSTSTVFTDENGEFIITNIPDGEYSVQAKKDGHITNFEGATILPNKEVNITFELQPENANNRQPFSPVAIYPIDNSDGIDIKVDLVWTSKDPENDDLYYDIELRNNNTNDVITYSNITDTTYTIEGLQYGNKYFWQIKVTDSINSPVLSSVNSFETLKFPVSRMLYVKNINGNNVIFANDENGKEYQLTSSTSNSFRPRKNNATNKIAFLKTVGSETQLFTMNPDGTQQFQVTSNIPVNGFNLNKIDFSWAYDGSKLVYSNFGKLYQINATGGGTQLIYTAPNGKIITEVDVSYDNSLIAILTNDNYGYKASIYTIDFAGNILNNVINETNGALGGLSLSIGNDKLLYTRDVSGYESIDYRQLDSRIFIYNFLNKNHQEISLQKENGTNDLDPRFSPNEAQIIFVNTSNDQLSPRHIFKTDIKIDDDLNRNRILLYENAYMPDWE